MPPKKKERPKADEREAVLKWIRTELRKTQQPGTVIEYKLLLAQNGNYIDHAALFREPAGPAVPPAPRLWRVRPEIYKEFAANFVKAGVKGKGDVSQPFLVLPGEGFKDFAAPYFIDDPTADLLFRNAELIVDSQTALKAGIPDLRRLVDPAAKPTRPQIETALRTEFQLALRRLPTPEESKRLLELYDKNVASGGQVIGGRETLIAILMHPEVVFRLELADSPVDPLGRRRLSPRELAMALSFVLRKSPDEELLKAAAAGALNTNEQVAQHAKRLLAGGIGANPRLLQFFREYFGCPEALEVFKDRRKYRIHADRILVNDLEYLILDILKHDREVLRELLTTRKVFVRVPTEAADGLGNLRKGLRTSDGGTAPRTADFAAIYGLPVDWKQSTPQPVTLSGGSFNALVLSLLTSDSFLYRSAEK